MRPGTCGETIAHRQTFFDQNFVLWRVASPCSYPKEKMGAFNWSCTDTDWRKFRDSCCRRVPSCSQNLCCKRAARIFAARPARHNSPSNGTGDRTFVLLPSRQPADWLWTDEQAREGSGGVCDGMQDYNRNYPETEVRHVWRAGVQTKRIESRDANR